MKTSLAITVFCLLCIALSAQSKKALRTFGIAHKIETVAKYKDGVEHESHKSEEEYYNKDGEWVRKLKYDKHGELKNEEIRVFDGPNITDYTEIDYNGSKKEDPYFKRTTYTFNKGRTMTETEWDDEGNPTEKRVYSYNKFGDEILETTTDEEGEVKKTEVSEYDKRGLKILESTYDADGVLQEQKRYTYD